MVNTILLYAKQKKLASLAAEKIYEKEQQSNLMIDILSHIVEFEKWRKQDYMSSIFAS